MTIGKTQWLRGGLVLAVGALAVWGWRGALSPAPTRPLAYRGGRDIDAVVRLTSFRAEPTAECYAAPLRIAVRRSESFPAVEDNDLRGHLDGTFKWGWNQPGQMHVRVGRRGVSPAYGEHELFRVLQRWDPGLPRGTAITNAVLRLYVEAGSDQPLGLYLYPVHRDWNPGNGGVDKDNTSPPAPGEVWWNDNAFGDRHWGLPGVSATGFDEAADTDPLPLAFVAYAPGNTVLTLASPALTDYLGQRVRAGLPFLFLLKLADFEEDIPGNQLTIYSANHGDNHNPHLRPLLELGVAPCSVTADSARPMRLEYGRTLTLPPVPLAAPGFIAVGLKGDASDATVSLRGGRGVDTTAWAPVGAPRRVDWTWAQVRVTAAIDPVPVRTPFRASLHDTWVQGLPAHEQEVVWMFRSPTGRELRRTGQYRDPYWWDVELVPDEIGRWSYHVVHQLGNQPYRSNEVTFDVVAGDQANIMRNLSIIGRPYGQAGLDSLRLMVEFARLERAAMQSLTPAEFHSEVGDSLRAFLVTIRERITGTEVPDQLPMRPSPRPPLRPR